MYRQAVANNILLETYPFPSELGMEAYLMDNPRILSFSENKNTDFPRIIDCEIPLKECKESGNRRIDILVQYDKHTFDIVELKKHAIDYKALRQLCDYLCEKEQIIKGLRNLDIITDDIEDSQVKFIGVLAGSRLDAGLENELPLTKGIKENQFSRFPGEEYPPEKREKLKNIPIHAITMNRFRNSATNEIFVLADTYIKEKAEGKDYTKYRFDGNIYNKSKLVHSVVKKYITQQPSLPTIRELENVFPYSLQGTPSFGVFKPIDIALKKGNVYYYIKDDQQIPLADGIIATCKQWRVDNIIRFIEQAEKLGYEISEVE